MPAPKIDTPKAFANAFTRNFAADVRDAAGRDGRLSVNEATKVAEPSRDNAVNFLEKTGQKSVSVDKLIGRAHDYALANAIRVTEANGGVFNAIALRNLPLDLRADADQIMKVSPKVRNDELRGLADKISLSAFGEDDSGDFVKFVSRKAKVDTLDSDTFLDSFGFSKAKQEGSDQYSFQPMRTSDWDNLLDAQPTPEARTAMERVREVMEPLGAKLVYAEDDRPFGAPVFLVAKGDAGDLFGFRATVGGMGF